MKLHPFRALVPPASVAGRVISPPYDVVNTAEARAFAAGNPLSFFHVTRPEIDLGDDVDVHADAVYAGARAALRRLVAEGALVRDDTPALWVYRLTQDGRSQTGFVGCAEVDAYADGRIKKHELTRQDKEDDRTRHVDEAGAQAGPVFLACRASEGLARLAASVVTRPAALDLTAPDGVRHEVWPVRDAAELSAAAAAFEALDAFYVADGHHRAASAWRTRELRRERGDVGAADRFLVVVFPQDELKILAYNRVVDDLNGLDEAELLRRLEASFEVGEASDAPQVSARHTFGLYLGGSWRRLTLRAGMADDADPVGRLDVAVLQDLVLDKILGIADPRTSARIQFVGGIRGTEALSQAVDAAGQGAAFAMFPTSLEELFSVADAGLIMPPKSTWFEPKLASGLFVHPLDADLMAD